MSPTSARALLKRLALCILGLRLCGRCYESGSRADGTVRTAGEIWRRRHDQPRGEGAAVDVALVGAAAGAAVAAAFPATDLENRTLGPTGERLRDAAGKAGEQLKDAATKAGQRLAAAADERGLNTEGLKEVARDVGETFSSALEGKDANQNTQPKSQSSSKLGRPATNQRDSSGKGGSH
jgi:hypothetical protein